MKNNNVVISKSIVPGIAVGRSGGWVLHVNEVYVRRYKIRTVCNVGKDSKRILLPVV